MEQGFALAKATHHAANWGRREFDEHGREEYAIGEGAVWVLENVHDFQLEIRRQIVAADVFKVRHSEEGIWGTARDIEPKL